MKNYTFIGSIESGEAIFYCPDDKSLAIEKDHTCLVEPTPEEAAQVYKIFPSLKTTQLDCEPNYARRGNLTNGASL